MSLSTALNKNYFKVFKTRWVLFVTIFMITVPTILVLSSFYYKQETARIYKNIGDQLLGIQKSKTSQIKELESRNTALIRNLSQNPVAINAMVDFKESIALLEFNFIEDTKRSQKDLARTNTAYMQSVVTELDKLGASFKAQDLIAKDPSGLILQDLYIKLNTNSKKSDLVDAKDDSLYTFFHKKHHAWFNTFTNENELYDLFLVNHQTGQILYTVQKEIDFGNNLKTSYLKDQGIGQVFQKAMNAKPGEVFFSDFNFYPPSMNESATFIATPLYEGSRQVGVLILQASTDNFYKSLSYSYQWEKNGLGMTGETLLIGLDGYLRNESRLATSNPEAYQEVLLNAQASDKTLAQFLKTNSNALIQKSETVGFFRAKKGESSIDTYKNYLGRSVLGSFSQIEFNQNKYVLVTEIEETEAYAPLESFKIIAVMASLVIMIIIGFVSYFVAGIVVRPIESLYRSVNNFSKGDYTTEFASTGKIQEIRDLTRAFASMAKSVAADIQFREDAKQAIEKSAKELEEANQRIQDSIRVSSGIQRSHLPTPSELNRLFKNAYSIWQPKDIIGGDFYWVTQHGHRRFAICGDCTGHGVPGAFMTLLAHSALELITPQTYAHASMTEIIQQLHEKFSRSLGLQNSDSEINDGFEASLLCFDDEKQEIYFVGAGQNLIIKHSNHQVTMIKGDKNPVGYKNVQATDLDLTVHSLPMSDSLFFLYTDGWATQVGQQHQRMMGSKTLMNAIESNPSLEPHVLGNDLMGFFNHWRGDQETRDDVTMLIIKG